MRSILLFTYSILAILILVLPNFGCESAAKERTKKGNIAIQYYVRYLQEKQQVKATISFSELDSLKKNKPKPMTEVLFQSKALSGKKNKDTFLYQYSNNEDFANDYIFQYQLEDQLFSLPKVKLNPITDFSVEGGKVSKTLGTTLTFQSARLQPNEQLLVFFNDVYNKTATVTFNDLAEEKTVDIRSEQLLSLTVGKGTLYLVRQQSLQEADDSNQFLGRTEFYTKVKNIEIVD
ncbi:MAG: hypothetical protein AAF960_13110 [Bacteroidota bacterium]